MQAESQNNVCGLERTARRYVGHRISTQRKFELIETQAPTRIRWSERSTNLITVPEGGYDLEKVSDTQTRVTIRNTFQGHGFGKLIVGFAVRAAIKDAPAFAQRIKSAAEAS